MRLKSLFIVLMLSISAYVLHAQEANHKGFVVDDATGRPIQNVNVDIRGYHKTFPMQSTNTMGEYILNNLSPGTYTLTFSAPGYEIEQMTFIVGKDGSYSIAPKVRMTSLADVAAKADLAELYVNEADLDNFSGTQNYSPILTASFDPFNSAAAFTFSPMRFKARGYDSEYQDTYMNGMLMKDMNSGYGPWSLWSGLNDATRLRVQADGLSNPNFNFGNIGGATNFSTRASDFRQGGRVTYSATNRTYNNRMMLSYATGMLKGGWAFAAAISSRWGQQSYQRTGFYQGYGYFFSAEKYFGKNHSLDLTVLGSPTKRGVASASTQEAYDLVGSNFYNPNMGLQNGRWRNARVKDYHEPLLFLNYYGKLSDKTNLNAGVGYRFGFNGYSALDWFNAPDPRPDYYRYLPSYFTSMSETPDEGTAAIYRELWQTNPNMRYVNWQRMYDINENNYRQVYDANGRLIAEGNQSEYLIQDRRADQRQWNTFLSFNHRFNDVLRLDLGANYRHNRTEYFNVAKDLLGGDFILNVDKFAERDFGDPTKAQMDLRHPNRIIRKGDKYGTDYYAHTQDAMGWINLSANLPHWDLALALMGGYTQIYREGLTEHGLFPNNSYGDSKHLNFFNYGAKANITYKINGFHYFVGNIAIVQKAPYFRNIFVSPRTRNSYVNNPQSEKIYSGDLSYVFRLPFLKGRVTGFYTRIKDQTRNRGFYDDNYRNFSNFVIDHIDVLHQGVELGLEAKLSPAFTLNGAFTYAQYKYANNPHYIQTVDNSEKLLEEGTVYWKNMAEAGTPQTAATVGLTYRSPWYWMFSINANYFDRSYIAMNPVLRTEKAREAFGSKYVAPEKLGHGFTLDASMGTSYILSKGVKLGINLRVSNILNNKNMKSGGFEQQRIRYTKDGQMMRPFDSKYYYMYGTTFFLNTYIQF